MSRNQVIEVECDRCDRTEYLHPRNGEDDDERDLLDKTHFKSLFLGESVVFEDLCTKCRKAVRNYMRSIVKAKDEEEDAEAPPSVEPTSNVTPPGEADPVVGADPVQRGASAS